MAAIFTTTSIALPLALLGIVWFRFAGIELRHLFLPQPAHADAAHLEHSVITSQTTGRAHDSLHVPHDPDTHSEPEEFAPAWLKRLLDRCAARGSVVKAQRVERTANRWEAMHELPHCA